AYTYATDKAAATLTEYARTHDPFKEIGKRSVTVEITSVVRASENSFQIKWSEQHYRSGVLQSTYHHTAILSIILQQPRDVEQLRRNPLGIYVHGLNWSRDVKLGENQ
ncbi:MAG: conjugal transfer protein TrbF, partial [Opitutaceae bacterium]|nr:conjugal transfer protein TrbF [Opitutaceae bacterium]